MRWAIPASRSRRSASRPWKSAPSSLTTPSRLTWNGDVWPTKVGFVSPLPAVVPGHYTAKVTFTVIGR